MLGSSRQSAPLLCLGALFCVLASFLGLAMGCGGGSSGGPPPPPSLTFVGSSQAAPGGGTALPPRNGLAKPTDAIEITARTAPQGSGTNAPPHTLTAVSSTDNFATQTSTAMTFVRNGAGPNSDQALWRSTLSSFPSGTEVQYFVRATAGGVTLTDNNGGANYEFNIPLLGSIPTSPPFIVLQWFATSWRDIQRRLPEVVQTGYNILYLPPPQKAATGSNSVGFDPFDRFDLGDRLQRGTVRTQYGTTQELLELVDAAHQLGLRVCFDTVANHNANRSGGVPAGGYPDQIPEDFHFQGPIGMDIQNFAPFGFQTFNWELLGLVDLAQEDGNKVAPPARPANPQISLNAQQKPSWVRHPRVPQYYPSGATVAEDIREYLSRWGQWMGQVVGADCYRLDAARHVPPPFWGGATNFTGSDGTAYAVTGAQQFIPALDAGVVARTAGKQHALVFGEIFNSDPREFAAYAKAGMNLLDFTLTFNAGKVFDPAGTGDLGVVVGNPPSGDAGMGFQFGGIDPTVALAQIHNHDVNLPKSENLAYAFLLTRAGQPIVYFDGNNLAVGSSFPKAGRTDALGEGDDFTARLVNAHNEYARGDMVNRSTSATLYVYERQVGGQGVLLVGLNARGDSGGAQTVSVDTAFQPGDVLVDLGGQQPAVTVGPDKRVTLTAPSNFSASQSNNGRGYVLYALRNPQSTGPFPVTMEQGGVPLPFQTFPTADGKVRDPEPGTTFKAPVVTGNTITIRLTSDSTAGNAVARLDGGGVALAGRSPIIGSAEGLSDGFVNTDGANGAFSLANIDLSGLREGLHVVEFRAFLSQAAVRPPIFKSFRQVFILQRPPAGTHTVDGNLSDFSSTAVKAVQTVATIDPGRNALNRLLVENDNDFLYIGLVGNADATEDPARLNGVVIWLDVDYGAGTGVTNFGLLNDDSGPATRLISSLDTTAPPGFGADFVLASFRGGELSTIQTLVRQDGSRLIGGPRAAASFGSATGFYHINPAKLSDLEELSAQIAWFPPTVANGGPAAETQPTGGPGNGMEVAIRIHDLFPGFIGPGLPPAARLAVHAYIISTGETGAILASDDPNRVTLGGRPRFRGTRSNQILTFCTGGCQ